MSISFENSRRLSRYECVGTIIRALRLHHWFKNLFLFAPTILENKLGLTILPSLCLAFVAFGTAASAHYLVNDLVDTPHDRQHFAKRRRPQAAGELPPKLALSLAAGLLTIAVVFANWLPTGFQVALAAYLVLCLAYSLLLKQVLIIDVLLLVVFFDLRFAAGASAAAISLSNTFILAASSFFLTVALFKRMTQLAVTRNALSSRLPGRAYTYHHLGILRVLSATAAVVSVLTFAGLFSEIGAQVARPALLWPILAILAAWLGRSFFIASSGELNEDIVVFVAADSFNLTMVVSVVLLLIAAVS